MTTKKVEKAKETSKVTEQELLEMEQALRGNGMTAELKQYKKEGFYYRLVSTRKKQMARYAQLGFTNVVDDEGETVRISSGGDSLILMCVPDERHEIIAEIKRKRNDLQIQDIEPGRKAAENSSMYI